MIHRLIASGLVVAGLASTALASNGRNPGSLLLYPEFDNRSGTVTVLTVTNVDTDETNAPIDVEFVYVGRFETVKNQDAGCLEFNRTETLTPADTFTCLTDYHNPDQEQGYAFLYAKDTATGAAVTHNYLTGNVMTVDGFDAFEFSVNPVSYLGYNADNGDGDLQLDGVEYSGTASEIVIPRFLGQTGLRVSDLILIGLSGDVDYNTTVDFLIFNDNEQVFSSEYTFRCWERVHLTDISNIFRNDFLASWTNHDPTEIVGAPNVESGWIHLTGHAYGDQTATFPDPSVYAVLVERIQSMGASDLPFEMGELRTNGTLRAVVSSN
jgi:hypothetical protein